jgi:3-hydroxyisobutyrate dehydrogenase-like beta-hydroxyacid dehydrogenase
VALKVAFLGMGRMGSRVAGNIAAGGFPTTLYNRTRARAEEVAAPTGASVANAPAAAARDADVVITMLADGPAVESVYRGDDGVLQTLRGGAVAVDLSTTGPTFVRRLAAMVAEAGASLVDAPVSGSVATAESGKLMLMVGGDDTDVERVRPILATAGSTIIHVGPSGAGATMKLAVNAIVFGLNQSISESLVLAEHAGIDRAVAYEVFANSAIAAPVVHYRREAFERPGDVAPSFTIDLAIKDLRLILGLAGDVGAAVPQTELNVDVMERAAPAHGRDDISAIAQHLRGA